MKHILWTIQHEKAFREFERTGILRANENHLFCENELRFAYDWLSREMVKRIGPPPMGVTYPVWAWYQWEGKRKRMDLRQSGYAMRGTPLVQITFEVEEDSFLLSDFDKWHNVLSCQYVAESEADWDAFYEKFSDSKQSDVESSWGRIFDLQYYCPEWDCTPDKQSVQATLWQIEMSQVKKVEHFLAK